MTSRLKTPLTELVGIEHPVVQTGMGWVAGARLVSATSNAGGLGILASATMTLDELKIAVGKVKAATDKPFGINIRADAGDANDRVDLLISEGVKVASFALAPKPDLIAKLKDAAVAPSISSPPCIHWYVIGSEPIADTASETLPPMTPRVPTGCVSMVTGCTTRTGITSLVVVPAKLLTSTV